MCKECGAKENLNQLRTSDGFLIICEACFEKLERDDEAEAEEKNDDAKTEIEIKMTKTFKVVWHGSRSNEKRLFIVSTNQRLDTFKQEVFRQFHGLEIDPDKYELEEDWTAAHNIRLKNYSTVCHKDWKTWQFYIDHLGIDISPSALPLDVTFQLVIGGGVKKTIAGYLKWTPEAASKLQMLPGVIEGLAKSKFDEDELREFMGRFTNEKIEEFAELWDHSKINNKHKVNEMMRNQEHMRFVDGTCEMVNRYVEQFKQKFHTNFNADVIKEELAYQIRRRGENAMSD